MPQLESHAQPIACNAPPFPARNSGCLVTKYVGGFDLVHISFKTVLSWLLKNAMHRHNRSTIIPDTVVINDVSDMAVLRADVYRAFDAKELPKKHKWVIHFAKVTVNLSGLYHNTHIRPHPGNEEADQLSSRSRRVDFKCWSFGQAQVRHHDDLKVLACR